MIFNEEIKLKTINITIEYRLLLQNNDEFLETYVLSQFSLHKQ